MFNTAQTQILESLIQTNAERGYHYYVAYTNTNTNTIYNTSVKPDLYVVFSTDKIEQNSAYSYTIPAGSVRYTIRSVNWSSSSAAVNTDRIIPVPFSGRLNIEVFEHVYTNTSSSTISYALQPDILKEGSVNFEYSALCAFLLGSLLFYLIFRDMWHTGQSFTKKVKNKR